MKSCVRLVCGALATVMTLGWGGIQNAFASGSMLIGYAQAEYIQGDGTTSFIATDFVPNPQTDRIVAEVEFTTVNHNQFIFCARKGTGNDSYSINVLSSGYKPRFDYCKQQVSATSGCSTGVKYTFEVCTNVLTYTSSEGSQTVTATAAPTFTAADKLYLFMAPGNTTSVGAFKLYSFKIYRNGELIHDLVPARDNFLSATMVDVVGSLSIENGGSFTLGNMLDAPEPSEEDILAGKVMTLYNEINPQTVNGRKYIALAYITDTHKCKRVEGDDDPDNPVTDYWYHNELVDPEPSIRLLGTIAQVAGIDGLIHAGDFSTAIPSVPFEEGDYLNEIRNVRAMVSTHLPDTPFFAVDGNHDRDYWNENRTSGHSMLDDEWAAVLEEINTDVTDIPEIVCTPISGNSYTLDFKRCLANGGKNIRLVMVSGYDTADGSNPSARLRDGLVFDDPSLTLRNTIVGLTAHDYCADFTSEIVTYLTKHTEAGFFGAITGHRHEAATEKIPGTFSDNIVVRNAFSSYGDTSPAAYRFSIVVFDTDNNRLREIRLAGTGNNEPTVIDHEISIGMEYLGVLDHELLAIDGNNSAYIETDFVPNPQTDKLVITLELPEGFGDQFAFSARANDTSLSYSLQLRGSTGQYRFDYKSKGEPTGSLSAGIKYTFEVENNVLTLNGGVGTTVEKDETFDEPSGPLKIFKAGGGNAAGNFRLYSFQIYRSGELIHDLRPYYSISQGATLADRIKGGDPITLKKTGGTFIGIEDPQVPSGTKRLAWIQGDGKGSYFETDFVPDPARDKIEVVATLANLEPNYKQFLFGARGDSTTPGMWDLWLVGNTKLTYDYITRGEEQERTLQEGVKYTFTADANELTWSHGEGISSDIQPISSASGPLMICWAKAALNNTYSTCKLHSVRVWRDGELIHEFLPTRWPSGHLNLMDYGPEPVLVTRKGFFRGVSEKNGLILMFR